MFCYLKALLIFCLFISSAFSQEECEGLCFQEIPSGGKGLYGKKLKKSLGSLGKDYYIAKDWSPLRSSSPGYKTDKELEKNAVNRLNAQLGTYIIDEMYESVSDSLQIRQDKKIRNLERRISTNFSSISSNYIKDYTSRTIIDEKENIKEFYVFLCRKQYKCERNAIASQLRKRGEQYYGYYKKNQDNISIQFKNLIKSYFYYNSILDPTLDDMAILNEINQNKEDLYQSIRNQFPKDPITVYQVRDVIGESIKIKVNLPNNFPLKLISDGYVNPDWGRMQAYQGKLETLGDEVVLDGFAVQSDINQTLNFFPDISGYYDDLKDKEKSLKPFEDTFELLKNEILNKTFYSFRIEIEKPKLGFKISSVNLINPAFEKLGKNTNTRKDLELEIIRIIKKNKYFDFAKSNDEKNIKILDVRYDESYKSLSIAINDNNYEQNFPFLNERYSRFDGNDIKEIGRKVNQGLNNIAETRSTGKLQYSICPGNVLEINGKSYKGSLNPQTISDLKAGVVDVQVFSEDFKQPYIDTQIYITAGEQGTDLASSITDLDNRYLRDNKLCFSDENETIYQLIIKDKPSRLKRFTLKWDNEDKSSLLKTGESIIQISDKSLSSHSLYLGYRGYQAQIEVGHDGKIKSNRKVKINKTISEIIPISVDMKKVNFKIQDILIPGTTKIRYYSDQFPRNKIIGNIWKVLSGVALLYTISEADNYFLHKEKYQNAIEAYEQAIMGDVSDEEWGNLSNEILLQKDLTNMHQSNLIKGGSFLGLGISINLGNYIFRNRK